MKNITILMISKSRLKKDILILIISIVTIYLLISLYFINHCLPNTSLNGANISFAAYSEVPVVISQYIKDYELLLIERNEETEVIKAQELGLQYNEDNRLRELIKKQKPLLWIRCLFRSQSFYNKELCQYDEQDLNETIDRLDCMNRNIIEPRNAGFRYVEGKYELIPEVYGNRIKKDCLKREMITAILQGRKYLDLNQTYCYVNPSFTMTMSKTGETLKLLNKYVSAVIDYRLGDKQDRIDGAKIKEWLNTDEELDVVLNRSEIADYVKELAAKYNTIGATRSFRTSLGKTVEVKGGIYGWILDEEEEADKITEAIKSGKMIAREPVFSQRALSMKENDIGDTYIEINITRQSLWFYKAGKLIAQGAVVTGNPNRGTPTVTGTYMLNYKQADTQLRGPGYEVDVKYFMPFYGGIGIHDASWRYSFGGDIYKRRGTHGCVNAPLYLAKKIFENIEPGTPIVCYEE